MKKLLIFSLLFIFINTLPHILNEEREKKRKEAQEKMVNCILNNQNASTELKKQVEKNKDNDLRRFFHSLIEKCEKNDQDVIRKCRREIVSNHYDHFKLKNFGRSIPSSIKNQYIKKFIK